MFRLFLIPTLAVAIIISFGLHTVQVDHVHPGHQEQHTTGTEGGIVAIDAYLHGTEHKFFFVLLFLAALTAWVFWGFTENFKVRTLGLLSVRIVLALCLQYNIRLSISTPRVFHLVELFRKGIFHPKLF